MFDPFQLEFVQRGIVEALLLSVACGLLGTWILARGLAFFSHAAGTAAFPGLVLADGLGFAAPLGAFALAVLFAFGVRRTAGSRLNDYSSSTALWLVGALAAGVMLASDVFHSGSNIESLLFGSLFVIGSFDLVFAAVAAIAVLAATATIGRFWLAIGFDREAATGLGIATGRFELALLLLVAVTVTSVLSAVGALLTVGLMVAPAATARIWTNRMLSWQVAAVVIAAAVSVTGIWLSVELNAPPGSTIAVVAAVGFALSAAAKAASARSASSAARKRAAVVSLSLALALLLVGCGTQNDSSNGRLKVVASTTQIADWLRIVGGDDVEVQQILNANVDPHDYEPRPADIAGAARAGLVFASGDGLDGWVDELIDKSGGEATKVDLGAAANVHLAGERSGPASRIFDPHWWHDPRNAIAAVGRIEQALAAANQVRAAAFRQRAGEYLELLRSTDRKLQACFSRIPAAKRVLVTDHDAFNYFARRYRLRVVGAVIPSQTTAAQSSARDLAALADTIRRTGVAVVFPEASLNDRLAAAVARETGARVGTALYGDTLGPPGSTGDTYVKMIAANGDAIARGIAGAARGCE